jgi:S1-C subfamily serine protease
MKGWPSHVITALVAVGCTLLVQRMVASRPLVVRAQNRDAQSSPAPPPRQTEDAASAAASNQPVDPASDPGLRAARVPADVDEQMHNRVYAMANRGVVNITAATAGVGFFGDEVAAGTGSGFVIDKKGHILTNYHVIADADALEVKLYDGSAYEGRVVGVDPSNDIAVLRIDGVPPDRLIPLVLGDSAQNFVGKKVLALGNPFGLERTLTSGIISSLDRSIRAKNGRRIKGIIQTDAAINPGNSGGPLLDSRGQVIGINTAIVSNANQYAGISFAVPVNTVKRILPQLLELGRVVRADLGLARVYATERGIYIIDLVEGGPADRAGLRPMQVVLERVGPLIRRRIDPDTADRIIAVDGEPVRSADELLSRVESHQPGETVTLTIIREGRERKVTVRLGQTQE